MIYLLGVILSLILTYFYNSYATNDMKLPLFAALVLSICSWIMVGTILILYFVVWYQQSPLVAKLAIKFKQ